MSYFLLILTPFMVAAGQILFKMTSDAIKGAENPVIALATSPIFILSLMIYGLATILWIFVLRSHPLSRAYMFMALTFIIVPIASWWIFKESISIWQGIGIILIMTGLAISQIGSESTQ